MGKQYNGNKFKNANMDFELCPLNKDLSFTINSAEAFDRLEPWLNHYMLMMKSYILPYIDIIEMYPELSSSGRLHYHGIVRFNNIDQIFGWYFAHHKVVGLNMSLDLITDKKIWQTYIHKQEKYMSYVLKKVSHPYKVTSSYLTKFNIEYPVSTREQFKFNRKKRR